jgi:hypothetical protein
MTTNTTPKRGRQWVWAPAKPKAVPKDIKDTVSAKAKQFVEMDLRHAYVRPPPKRPRWNYIVDIFTKWHGIYFYFIARYACPGPNAISPFFEAGFARLEWLRDGHFNLAYMRHTGEWWQVRTDITLAEALEAIRAEPIFQR